MAKMLTSALLGVALIATAGCAKKREIDIPPPTDQPPPVINDNNDDDYNSTLQQRFRSEVGNDTIHFDFDQFDLDAEDRAILDAHARWLIANPNIRATIEGHCDERGTREYNLALGDRRANAAKNYLVTRGVSATRITTISYGKERPIALGSDEGSWAQNRRAVTIVIG